MKTCAVEGCSGKSYCKGLCTKHYQRQRTHGTTDAQVAPTTEERFWAKVNKTDGCWNWAGSTTHNGYGDFQNGGKTLRSHRVSYEWANGPIPDGMQIDHICHNRRCVNPEHLRTVTPKQNSENLSGPTARSTSGVRGVTWSKKDRRWIAQVQHQGKGYVGGYFRTIAEAEASVISLRNKLFTHNNIDDPTHAGYPKEVAA
jgi:hypothetical protein